MAAPQNSWHLHISARPGRSCGSRRTAREKSGPGKGLEDPDAILRRMN